MLSCLTLNPTVRQNDTSMMQKTEPPGHRSSRLFMEERGRSSPPRTPPRTPFIPEHGMTTPNVKSILKRSKSASKQRVRFSPYVREPRPTLKEEEDTSANEERTDSRGRRSRNYSGFSFDTQASGKRYRAETFKQKDLEIMEICYKATHDDSITIGSIFSNALEKVSSGVEWAIESLEGFYSSESSSSIAPPNSTSAILQPLGSNPRRSSRPLDSANALFLSTIGNSNQDDATPPTDRTEIDSLGFRAEPRMSKDMIQLHYKGHLSRT